jgi:hypothetical protein
MRIEHQSASVAGRRPEPGKAIAHELARPRACR